jgi:hypothetical protein
MIFFEPVCASTIKRRLRRTLVLLVLYSAIPKTTETLRRKGAQRRNAFVSFVAAFARSQRLPRKTQSTPNYPNVIRSKDYLRMNKR